jgi:hypothetical protein
MHHRCAIRRSGSLAWRVRFLGRGCDGDCLKAAGPKAVRARTAASRRWSARRPYGIRRGYCCSEPVGDLGGTAGDQFGEEHLRQAHPLKIGGLGHKPVKVLGELRNLVGRAAA